MVKISLSPSYTLRSEVNSHGRRTTQQNNHRPKHSSGKTSNKRNPHTSIPNHRTTRQRPNPTTNPKRISGTQTRRH